MSKAAKRTVLAAALAAAGLAIVLAFAGVAGAAPATSSPAGATAALGEAAPAYGWVVQLRGAINKDLTGTQFAALRKDRRRRLEGHRQQHLLGGHSAVAPGRARRRQEPQDLQ